MSKRYERKHLENMVTSGLRGHQERYGKNAPVRPPRAGHAAVGSDVDTAMSYARRGPAALVLR